MAVIAAEQTIVCPAPPQVCFDAIADFESYPAWQSAVRSATVRSRDAAGRGDEVELVVDVKIRRIRYVLRHHYDEPARMWWEYVEGDVKSIAGEFRFDDNGDGTTTATYRVAIDPGLFVPGPVRKLLAGQVMRTVVAELRDRVASA